MPIFNSVYVDFLSNISLYSQPMTSRQKSEIKFWLIRVLKHMILFFAYSWFGKLAGVFWWTIMHLRKLQVVNFMFNLTSVHGLCWQLPSESTFSTTCSLINVWVLLDVNNAVLPYDLVYVRLSCLKITSDLEVFIHPGCIAAQYIEISNWLI